MGRGNAVSKKGGSRHCQKKTGRKAKTPSEIKMGDTEDFNCGKCRVPTVKPDGFCIDCSETDQVSEHLKSTCEGESCKEKTPGGTKFCDLCASKRAICKTCRVSIEGDQVFDGQPRLKSIWCPAPGHQCFRCWCETHEMLFNFRHCEICFVNSRDRKKEMCKFCGGLLKCKTDEFGSRPMHACVRCFSTRRISEFASLLELYMIWWAQMHQPFCLTCEGLNEPHYSCRRCFSTGVGAKPDSPLKEYDESWVQFHQPPCLTCSELVEPRPVLRKEWYNHTSEWLDRSIAPQCRACKKRRNRSLTLLALKSVYEAGLESCIPFDVRTHLCPEAKL